MIRLATVLFVLSLFAIVAFGQEADKDAIKKVLIESNRLEMLCYADPANDDNLKAFKGTVIPGGSRDEEVSGRISRARKAGRKALNVEHVINTFSFKELTEFTAEVDTEETGGFEWSDGASPPFSQDHRRHTYKLTKNASGKWLIVSEAMHRQ